MIVPLTRDDANVIAFFMRDIDAREVLATQHGDYRHEFAEDCALHGGWCFRDPGGLPVAMGGIYECWPGVGNAWMVATPGIARHGLAVTRAAKQEIAKRGDLHRIQAFSADFHRVSHRWLEVLGFRRGAVLKKFGKCGADFIVFEMVR